MGRDIDRDIQRSRQYWYDDGLTEIATGCILLAVGFLFLAEALGAIPSGASSLGLIAVVFGGALAARRIVHRLKARITYPRTGYVRYRQPGGRRRSRILPGIVAAGMAALVAVLFLLAPLSLAWIPALDGFLIGAYLLYMAQNIGLGRFYLLACFSALAGSVVSLAGLGDILGSGVYFSAMGLAVVTSGAVTLLRYLRSTRPPEGEQP